MTQKPNRKELAASYRQEIIQDVTLFTSQSTAVFYDRLFSTLDYKLPRAVTGRKGFPKEAMLCAFLVMKCEGFSQISDLVDYLENNRLIAYYCGFNIMKPLPSYWTYARFLRQVNNSELKEIMAALVRKLYDEGIVDASFIGLDSTPISANTRYNNPKSFAKNKFSKKNPPKRDRDCALGVHSASNQHNERRYEFYWGYKSHVLVDCISGLPLYELTTPANTPDSNVAAEILANANQTISLQNCSFIADIPFLSRIFLENHIIQKPIRAIVRKGKERFVCDVRLAQRLEAVKDKKKNIEQLEALLSLRTYHDLDAVTGLSGFDRRQVCVPKFCEKSCQQRSLCRYHQYLKEAKSAEISIQICNHNYLLADAAHRLQALHPLLNDYQALVIDEAHKLPDAARQMYGQSLSAEDFREICDLLAKEKHILAAQQLNEKFSALMRSMCRDEPPEEDRRTAFVLTPDRITALRDCLFLLRQTQKQLAPYLPRWISYRLGAAENILNLFFTMDRKYILYIQYDRAGAPSLCAASREIPKQLNQALWLKNIPAILTSGTLMAGGSFDRPQKIMGLSENQRVENFIAASPFNYEENCLLYIPDSPLNVQIGSEKEVEYLAEQICRLVEAAHGHTLVLFTSYALMGAVYNQVKDRLPFPLLEVWRHSSDMIHKFKHSNNAVLFAAGSCWEGVDFPGDMVSSLIIVRLPFSVPNPLSEAEREQYPSLQDYIRAVIIPDMQVKLRQGFGRAIRTETDTCVISILDHRAAPGERYHQAVLEALPNLRITRKIKEVEEFIRAKKSSDYFLS